MDTASSRPVLILGIGNILLSDEGIGVRVVEALRSRPLPDHVDVVDGGTAGADLVEAMSHRRKVIVIDAMDAGDPPGTIRRLTPDDLLPGTGTTLSLHEIGLLDALAMTRHLSCEPAEVIIFGIQPQTVDWGTELSPVIADRVPELMDLVLSET